MTAPLVAIDEFCETSAGSTPARSNVDEFYGGSIPWVKSGELRDDVLASTEETVTEEGVRAARLKRVPAGTILIAMYGATVGRTAMLAVDATTNQAVCHVRPDPAQADKRYVWLALRAKLPELLARRAGGAQPNISQETIKSTRIRLPTLAEQRRIADILDKADAIRRKRKQSITLTDTLLRSTFLDLFGDPITNPKGWSVKPLGEVIDRFDAGWSANGEPRPIEGNEYGVLKISAVTSGWFRPSEHKAVAAAAIDRNLVTPSKGDLLFSRANTRELVAATCLVDDDEPRLFLPDKLWRIVPNAKATTTFLKYLLSDERLRVELTKTATGTSGSMLNISMEKVRALRVPLPPMDCQLAFDRRVWSILRLRRLQQRAVTQSEGAFTSLVDRAFAGAL